MTQDQTEKIYAVICLHCRQPIVISQVVAERQQETSNQRARKCQVFHLRCTNCGKEKPYRIAEIFETDDSAPAQPVAWDWQNAIARSTAAGR